MKENVRDILPYILFMIGLYIYIAYMACTTGEEFMVFLFYGYTVIALVWIALGLFITYVLGLDKKMKSIDENLDEIRRILNLNIKR